MPKKVQLIVDEIQQRIEIARSAVDKISEQPLKIIAFQVVLEKLLASANLFVPVEGKVGGEIKEAHPQEKPKSKPPKGLKGRVEALIDDGIFGTQKTLGDVKGALETRGWFHRVEAINPALLRLVKEKKLRRIKEPEKEGGKLVWRYSNW